MPWEAALYTIPIAIGAGLALVFLVWMIDAKRERRERRERPLAR